MKTKCVLEAKYKKGEELKTKLNVKKGDLIVIVIIAAAILGFTGVNYFNTKTGDLAVEIRVNSELVDTFSLTDTLEKTYETEYGTNVISIKDGKVSVVEADCRDLICVHTKAGEHSGDAIVCIPNRFTVEVIGENSEVDVIAQ